MENDIVLTYNEGSFVGENLISYKKVGKGTYLIVKRVLDIISSIILLLVSFPIFLMIMFLVYIEDGGKSIYKQKRIGKNGKIINIYKFRSMVVNAEEVLKEMLKDEKNRIEWQKYQKFSNDHRITKIGKILRKTSLDELPQLFNVLKGDMSFIGPRPLVVGELDDHNGNHELYESVTPGITGWWASHGRSDISYEERLDLEYFYIRNISFILDVKCFWATIKSVLLSKGAK